MQIDKIVNDDDLIEFLSEQYKQTNNLNFIAAAHAIELYRRSNEILSWQLAQHDWISVDERLPTYEDGKVLIYTAYGISIAQKTTTNHWKGDNAIPKFITHWMPLPEPPTAKEN